MSNSPRTGFRPASLRFRLTRRCAAVSLLTLGAFCLPPAGRAVQEDDPDTVKITAIRFWSLGDVTRVAIEATGELRFRSDRLENPGRVFFDFAGARPQLGARGVSVIAVGDRLVRQIRVAETQHGVTRVVLDVNGDVAISTELLANPERLMVEVRKPGAPRPTAAERRAEPEPDRPARREPRPASLSVLTIRRDPDRSYAKVWLPDPPSPFDPGLRYATHPYDQPDPLLGLHLTIPGPVQPPRSQPAIAFGHAKISESSGPAPGDPVGLPAKRAGQTDTMIRVLGLKLARVVIDPGHGGNDGGTTGPGGLREKDVALDVAQRLGLLIQERLGSEVVLTRTDDTFIPLGRRTEIANEIRADLFLSIHVNSSSYRAVSGFETYILNFTSSKTDLETAMRENAGSNRTVGDLQELLKKIVLRDKADESRELASRVQASLLTLEPKSVRGTRDRGIKRAPFVVLIGASMPSVLAEIGFISNAREESLMRKPEYRQRIAEALYKGVAAYANSLSHFQVAQQSSEYARPSRLPSSPAPE